MFAWRGSPSRLLELLTMEKILHENYKEMAARPDFDIISAGARAIQEKLAEVAMELAQYDPMQVEKARLHMEKTQRLAASARAKAQAAGGTANDIQDIQKRARLGTRMDIGLAVVFLGLAIGVTCFFLIQDYQFDAHRELTQVRILKRNVTKYDHVVFDYATEYGRRISGQASFFRWDFDTLRPGQTVLAEYREDKPSEVRLIGIGGGRRMIGFVTRDSIIFMGIFWGLFALGVYNKGRNKKIMARYGIRIAGNSSGKDTIL